MVDAIILVALACVLTLIIRGMLRGHIRTCDSASCGGNCASCHGSRRAPRLVLSEEQKRQLQALGKRGEQP